MSEWEEQDDNSATETDTADDIDVATYADIPDDGDTVEAVEIDEENYSPHKPEYPTFWQMIRRFFFQTAAEKQSERHRRLSDLNRAIQSNPDVAANYLLRGEVRLEQKDYELARDDFLQAIELAQTQFDNEKWGIAAQSIMDRAHEGLQETLRYLD